MNLSEKKRSIESYLKAHGITGFELLRRKLKVGMNQLFTTLEQMKKAGKVMIHSHAGGYRILCAVENRTCHVM